MGDERNVHPYRRQKLEPEITAMSVELLDEEELPTVIVNVDHSQAKSAIRKVIVLLGGAAGLAAIVRRTTNQHPAVVALAGGAASAGLAATLTAVVIDRPLPPPPTAIERIVTVPASPQEAWTVTTTVRPLDTAKPSTNPAPPASLRAEASAWPFDQPTQQESRQPEPTPRRTLRTPPASTPESSAPRHVDSDQAPPSTTAAARPVSEPEQQTRTPWAEQPPPTAAVAGCDGIGTAVNPLLEVCLLG